jgi:pyrimidine-nucleoside phosphorylase
MLPNDVIGEKRDGEALGPEVLSEFLLSYLAGEVEEYQMAAWLMAVVFRGLSETELRVLLETMIGSGQVLEWPEGTGPVVDKHSTGGVGDKVSLVLAPLAAEMGIVVPMISGRGLGHTTGTLDKLEAIPGFRTDLPLADFRRIVDEVGLAMIGQTPEIAPLDRRLYALRSVTGTVPAIPLIAASIMSKKLAEGLDGLVLDVKVGHGAFLPDVDTARELARTMVGLGQSRGIRATALLTAMDRPLGRGIGNALETVEAIRCLRGEGPADLQELVLRQLEEMVVNGGLCPDDPDSRRETVERGRSRLADGSALGRFQRLIAAQGGDPGVVENPDLLLTAPTVQKVVSPRSGVVGRIATRRLGQLVVELGGGRTDLNDAIDLSVGLVLEVGLGSRVERGQVLAEVHARDTAAGEAAAAVVLDAITVSEDPSGLESHPLVLERVGPQAQGPDSLA